MIEYYPARLTDRHFKLSKFSGNEQAENEYFLVLRAKGERGHSGTSKLPELHCDCPNRRRSKHINDKHGQMIAKWIILGEPQGCFDEQGEFHVSTDAGIPDESATDLEDDSSGEGNPDGDPEAEHDQV